MGPLVLSNGCRDKLQVYPSSWLLLIQVATQLRHRNTPTGWKNAIVPQKRFAVLLGKIRRTVSFKTVNSEVEECQWLFAVILKFHESVPTNPHSFFLQSLFPTRLGSDQACLIKKSVTLFLFRKFCKLRVERM